MRIALFSDIHGNVVGLREIFSWLKTYGGADVIFALGDYLAVGPGGDDLMELLLENNVRMIRGNWDEIFIDLDAYLEKLPADTHNVVLRHYEWLVANTSPETRELLRTLPLTDELETESGNKLFVCHAAPGDTWSRFCSADVEANTLQAVYGGTDADVIAYGHYHNHHVISLDQKLLLNVASVGMRKGGHSAFTIIDDSKGRLVVQQYQVPYDTDVLLKMSRDRGVPGAD